MADLGPFDWVVDLHSSHWHLVSVQEGKVSTQAAFEVTGSLQTGMQRECEMMIDYLPARLQFCFRQ